MPIPFAVNADKEFKVTCHHQDFEQFCGPACLMMLINHLKDPNNAKPSQPAVTSQMELYKSLMADLNAGDYGMKAPPVPMRNVLNERVDKANPSYKIIWGETGEAMAKRIVECLLNGLGPVLLPINQKNHWILICSAKTDAKGNLDYVGVRDPVTVNPPPFDPTGPKYDHTAVLDDQAQSPGPDPCRHDEPHLQERRLDAEGLLLYLTPTQWGYHVFRNLAIVPVAVPDLAAEKDGV